MKILIDIGHPAHLHYFKNFAKIMTQRGYEFLFVVRERDSTIELAESLGFPWVSRGRGGKTPWQKIMMIATIDYKIYTIARKFKPDMFLSFSSPYAAHVATLMRKPHIALDDTEHAKFEHALCRPFTDVVISPSCYNAKLSKNQLLFNSYLELLYLHPNYFTPNRAIKKELGLDERDKYVVLRFISWDANHDIGQHGLTCKEKRELVDELEKYCRIFISSETELGSDLEKYRLKLHPVKLHDVLASAELYIGEGSTTASESAVLGTPAIYINSLNVGLIDDEERYGLAFHLNNFEAIMQKVKEILSLENTAETFKAERDAMLKEKIDPTDLLVKFVEGYPASVALMKKEGCLFTSKNQH